jgi:hypothetical protein
MDLVHSGTEVPEAEGSSDQLGGRAAVRMAHITWPGPATNRNSQLLYRQTVRC